MDTIDRILTQSLATVQKRRREVAIAELWESSHIETRHVRKPGTFQGTMAVCSITNEPYDGCRCDACSTLVEESYSIEIAHRRRDAAERALLARQVINTFAQTFYADERRAGREAVLAFIASVQERNPRAKRQNALTRTLYIVTDDEGARVFGTGWTKSDAIDEAMEWCDGNREDFRVVPVWVEDGFKTDYRTPDEILALLSA